MKKLLLLLPAVLLLAVGCGSAAVNNSVGSITPTLNNQVVASSSLAKFSNSPYYANSYLISGDSLSPASQNALTGFTLAKQTLPDGTTQFSLTAKETGYNDQSYILQPGQQLYFMDSNLGDDAGGSERNQIDDFGIVVDANGNIVSTGQTQ